jgi:hypothetical protein
MISLEDVETDLKNYKLTHEAVIIKKANTIGFAGKPGREVPVLPLSAYVQLRNTSIGGRHVMATMNGGDPITRGQTGNFDPKNFGKLSTRSFMDEPAKADQKFVDFEVQSMYDTYLARVGRGEFDPRVVPFAAEIFDQKLKNIEHYIRRLFFLSVKNANAADGGSSTDLIDGWIKQIADDVASATAEVVTVDTAMLTSTNAFAQIELLYAEIPAKDFLSEDFVVIMSLNDFRAYKKAYNDFFKYQLMPGADGVSYLHDAPSIKIAVEESWANNRPLITTIDNLVAAVDYNQLGNIRPYYDDPTRTLKLMQDFKVGAGIAQLDKIYMGVAP